MATSTTAITTRPRGSSTAEALRTSHTVSLKVLRLSRPSLHYQYPLPPSSISRTASLAYAAADPTDTFIISPVLTLPESFRSAYVGEDFACTLSANNELLPSDTARSVTGVRILAELQLPTGESVTLDFESEGGGGEGDIAPGASMQKIVRVNLSEAGQHVLAVTVTYSESEGGMAGRARTFRKLYQFVAQPLINVKTKTGDVVGREGRSRYALEAQLQNLGDRTVCLEAVSVNPAEGFLWRSLNWDVFGGAGDGPAHAPILHSNDTLQVAFLLEEKKGGSKAEVSGDRVTLGQLSIQWRSALGDRGSLKTSWLTGRRR